MARGNKRSKQTPQQFCYIFAQLGECKFGEACKFHHDLEEFFGPAFAFYQNQQGNRRERLETSVPLPPPFTSAYETKSFEESSSILFVHENGIVGVCLASTHPLFANAERSSKFSIKQNCVQGSNLTCNQVLCTMEFANNAAGGEEPVTIAFRVPIPGKLIQFNSKLEGDPDLLLRDAENKGFLCLIKACEPYPLMFPRFFSARTPSSNEVM